MGQLGLTGELAPIRHPGRIAVTYVDHPNNHDLAQHSAMAEEKGVAGSMGMT